MTSMRPVAATLVRHLRQQLPGLLAIYLFGSRAVGTEKDDSDWDLAIWVDGKIDPEDIWSLSGDLASLCGADVDLVDLGRASTVMQYQVVVHGVCIWQRDVRVDSLEAMVLREKADLDQARALLLSDIRHRGTIYE